MVVLATKLYVEGDAGQRALDSLAGLVADRFADLVVDFDVGLRDDGFPSVTVEGPDATVARNLLQAEFGALVPDRADGEVHVGTLETWNDDGFVLDAGFGERVAVPADRLDLGPGTPGQIRTRYGLIQHVPLEYVAGDPAELSGEQRDELYEWTRGPGRVNVNSATRSEVRATVNRAGHAADVVTVERLGVLEQSIVCRSGTDPPGLLASIGEYLPSELLCVVP